MEMNLNLENYFAKDEPIPYKNLLFHPVLVSDYFHFQMVSNCIVMNKNEIPDPTIISMSYLDFIFMYASQSEQHALFLQLLNELLKLCLDLKDEDIKYKFDEKGKVNLIIKDEVYDRKDFDIFRYIICKQNGIELEEDDKTHPDIKKALKEEMEFKNYNKKKMCSFEDQIICVMVALHEPDKQKILKMTIRTFLKVIARYDFKLHYEINKTAEASGMVSFKQEIDHWMSDLSIKPEDIFKGKIDFDEFKSNFNKL